LIKTKLEGRIILSAHFLYISGKLGFSFEKIFYMYFKILPSKQMPISNNSEFFIVTVI